MNCYAAGELGKVSGSEEYQEAFFRIDEPVTQRQATCTVEKERRDFPASEKCGTDEMIGSYRPDVINSFGMLTVPQDMQPSQGGRLDRPQQRFEMSVHAGIEEHVMRSVVSIAPEVVRAVTSRARLDVASHFESMWARDWFETFFGSRWTRAGCVGSCLTTRMGRGRAKAVAKVWRRFQKGSSLATTLRNVDFVKRERP
ncbi:hypothetical protein PHSY_004413 [Pseudozyma hubeiensis SY62]|uniref:Uncharacterized protein n=1 Tax=Pseudozyma hubeiensis (strain SY62) TaxID=1305764 RepID=R9P682_PSEHS|nr:hypothetical protein PHSY_004413 [Pseudozyma hubeiensis SY62]GAC96829.1 hypothetical protein PHSY_004413 [Pseudozyma hubeiensis SY62]